MLLISTKSPQKKKDFPIFFAINDLFRLLEAVKTLAVQVVENARLGEVAGMTSRGRRDDLARIDESFSCFYSVRDQNKQSGHLRGADPEGNVRRRHSRRSQ